MRRGLSEFIKVGHVRSEQEFFHELNVELIAKKRRYVEVQRQAQLMIEAAARRRAQSEQELLRLAEVARIDNLDVVRELQDLGYRSETAPLFYLVPLVKMAWADGSVGHGERHTVLHIARLHGIQRDTPAYDHLAAWLKRLPGENFLQGSWRVVRTVLRSLLPNERRERTDRLMQECRTVAAASGGILRDKVCAAEKKLLEQMQQELQPEPQAAVRAEADC
jgi:hypothetical protein